MAMSAGEIEALIKEGIPVDSLNSQGATPLHWAAFKGHTDVGQYLLKKGANVNALTTKGSTPLRLATSSGLAQVVPVAAAAAWAMAGDANGWPGLQGFGGVTSSSCNKLTSSSSSVGRS